MGSEITEDQGPGVIKFQYVWGVLATIAVILRFCGRYATRTAGFWWDDWLSLVALPFVWSICGVSLYWVSIGLGRHISQIPGPHTQLAKLLIVNLILYNTGFTVVRLSVLFFYVRIFRSVHTYRMIFWTVGSLIIGSCIATNFLAIFACVPIHKAWDPAIPGHCLDPSRTFLGSTILNILIDIVLLVLPIPMIWKLSMNTSSRLALIVVFCSAAGVPSIAVRRLISIIGIGNRLAMDLTWNFAYPQDLITAEIAHTLVSSCMPSMFSLTKHILQVYAPTFFGTPHKSDRMGAPVGFRLGHVDNPVESDNDKGFMQLKTSKSDIGGSEEDLTLGMKGKAHTIT